MIKRHIEMAVFLILALVIPLLMLIFANATITGNVVLETPLENDGVIVSGVEFVAFVDGKAYHYIFDEEKNEWHESKDELSWEYRVDMGESIWSGLIYLQSYDAEIYFQEQKIDSLREFREAWT